MTCHWQSCLTDYERLRTFSPNLYRINGFYHLVIAAAGIFINSVAERCDQVVKCGIKIEKEDEIHQMLH